MKKIILLYFIMSLFKLFAYDYNKISKKNRYEIFLEEFSKKKVFVKTQHYKIDMKEIKKKANHKKYEKLFKKNEIKLISVITDKRIKVDINSVLYFMNIGDKEQNYKLIDITTNEIKFFDLENSKELYFSYKTKEVDEHEHIAHKKLNINTNYTTKVNMSKFKPIEHKNFKLLNCDVNKNLVIIKFDNKVKVLEKNEYLDEKKTILLTDIKKNSAIFLKFKGNIVLGKIFKKIEHEKPYIYEKNKKVYAIFNGKSILLNKNINIDNSFQVIDIDRYKKEVILLNLDDNNKLIIKIKKCHL